VAEAEPWLVEGLRARFARLPGGPWPEAPDRALVQPLLDPSRAQPVGVLVTGLSPRRPLDDEYRGFLGLVAGHVAAAIADARAAAQEAARVQALADLDRAKTEFFSNVSHEFRTPLTLLLGATDELLGADVEPLPEHVRHHLEVVRRGGLRLHRLVDTLLQFARVEAGRITAVFQPTDLGAVTAGLASVFRSAVERAGLRYVVAVEDLPEPVFLDRELWEDVVLNLLSNALKHTFEGSIEVRVDAVDDSARLRIVDTGVGIPDEELHRIFHRFERVRGTRSRSHEGTGIGLALVKELVELHGGTVTVTSEVDAGTEFAVVLPYGDAHLPAEHVGRSVSAADPVSAGAAHLSEAITWLDADAPERTTVGRDGHADGRGSEAARVLVVDDNADMRAYIGAILGRHWQVDYAADGMRGLQRAVADPPDLVLTDVMMPGMDGFAFLRALRHSPSTAAVPVIMLSVRAGPDAAVEGLDEGADDYLVKPFTAPELVARVRANLELVRLRRERIAIETREELLAGFSHDLQTPLAVIVGVADVLGGTPLPESLREGVDALRTQAARLRFLVQRFLDYARLEGQGSLTLDVGPVPVPEVVERAVRLSAEPHRIAVAIEDDVPPVRADRERLEQVLVNLLSNAIRFSPPDAAVRVHARQLDGRIELGVTDEGTGMAQQDADRAFDRFFRAGPTAASAGTGLGLYLTRAIVEALDGEVQVDTALGRGSTFTVRLPTAGGAAR
jgi:signal transduction histidine kinase